VSNPCIDFGQGLLECLAQLHAEVASPPDAIALPGAAAGVKRRAGASLAEAG
jgi:hypothetical protein